MVCASRSLGQGRARFAAPRPVGACRQRGADAYRRMRTVGDVPPWHVSYHSFRCPGVSRLHRFGECAGGARQGGTVSLFERDWGHLGGYHDGKQRRLRAAWIGAAGCLRSLGTVTERRPAPRSRCQHSCRTTRRWSSPDPDYDPDSERLPG